MDVTFLENVSFFDKNPFQGENVMEGNFWVTDDRSYRECDSPNGFRVTTQCLETFWDWSFFFFILTLTFRIL